MKCYCYKGRRFTGRMQDFFHSAVLLKIISLSSSIKEGHFLTKKKEEKGQQIKVNWWRSDVIYTYFTFLHDEATLIFHSSWVRIAFPILTSLYRWIFSLPLHCSHLLMSASFFCHILKKMPKESIISNTEVFNDWAPIAGKIKALIFKYKFLHLTKSIWQSFTCQDNWTPSLT